MIAGALAKALAPFLHDPAVVQRRRRGPMTLYGPISPYGRWKTIRRCGAACACAALCRAGRVAARAFRPRAADIAQRAAPAQLSHFLGGLILVLAEVFLRKRSNCVSTPWRREITYCCRIDSV